MFVLFLVLFFSSVLLHGAIYTNMHSSSRICQNTWLRILNIIIMHVKSETLVIVTSAEFASSKVKNK